MSSGAQHYKIFYPKGEKKTWTMKPNTSRSRGETYKGICQTLLHRLVQNALTHQPTKKNSPTLSHYRLLNSVREEKKTVDNPTPRDSAISTHSEISRRGHQKMSRVTVGMFVLFLWISQSAAETTQPRVYHE